MPFLAVHLLFINLLTDSLPAIAIGVQDYHEDILNDKPREKTKHFIDKKLIGKILLEGILIFLSCFIGYIKGLIINIDTARTMAFSILCLARLFHSFNCSTKESILKCNKINKTLLISFIFGVLLINCVLFIPYLKNIFVISNLSYSNIILLYLLR